jgi:hypothetical protein
MNELDTNKVQRESIHDILSTIQYQLFDISNLSMYFKSIAFGMPLAILVGFFPKIFSTLVEKMPQFFSDKKFAKRFQEYCEKRADELRKNPEVQDVLKTGNVRNLVKVLKKHMTPEDEKIHREAIERGFGKQKENASIYVSWGIR